MQIGVYGSGYLATVISACLADFGMPVTCVDDDIARITAMSQGVVPYFEKNLTEVVRRNLRAGRLMFSSEITSLSRQKQLVFIAPDTSNYIEDVCTRISRVCVDPVVIVICTPVPVGTAAKIEAKLKACASLATVVSHPVFVTDGCAVEDFNWPDRILLGTSSAEAVSMIKQLYRPLVMRGVPVIVTNHNTAELVREAATAFVATKISFINELAGLCEHVNADAMDLALALGLDKKVAPRCLQPGSGFGGPFTEVDMDSLAQLAYSKGVALKVLSAARDVNYSLCDRVIGKITSAVQSLQGKQIAMLGLAFKPHTNSVAGSASIAIARKLIEKGARVNAFDPAALAQAKLELNGNVNYCDSPYAAAEGTDALVISTNWPEFKALDFPRIKKVAKRALIVDPKNMLDAPRMKAMGFEYVGMGRVPVQ
jgi:UDPglucose 6-dehydrogenase